MAHGMILGYMHSALDKGMTPAEAATLYMRNFGALIMLRDSNWDEPISLDAFEPAAYYQENVTEDFNKLQSWREKARRERLEEIQNQVDQAIVRHQNNINEILKQNDIVRSYLAFAERMIPATPEHEEYVSGFKKMCEESIQGTDWDNKQIEALVATDYNRAVASRELELMDELARSEERLHDEIKRQADRKAWYLKAVEIVKNAGQESKVPA